MPSVKIRVESVSDDELNAQKQGDEAKQKDTNKEKIAAATIFAHQVIATSKKIANAYASNIALFTGDSVRQENIQLIMGVGGDLAGLASSIASGGWVGAVIWGVAEAVKVVAEEVNYRRKSEITEKSLNYVKERNGNTLYNGSRARE